MTLSDFIAKYTGQAVSYDGVAADYGQCEQLVCLWWEQAYGFKCPPIEYAYQLWTNPTILQNFSQVAAGHEQAGDVAVWGPSALINSPAGHTDIVVNPGFLGFDSNWGNVVQTTPGSGKGYPAAHEVQHNYTDVYGFLRFKGDNMDYEAIAKDALNYKNPVVASKAWTDPYNFAGTVNNIEPAINNLVDFRNAVTKQLGLKPNSVASDVIPALEALQNGFTPYTGEPLFVSK